MNVDSSYLDLVYKYAESLRRYNEYVKATTYYYQVYKKDRGRLYPLAPFWYATMLKYNGKYKASKKFFKRTLRFFIKDKQGYHYQKILQEIKSCDVAIQILKDAIPIAIQNIGNTVNTYNSELGATLLNDSVMIYAALRG